MANRRLIVEILGDDKSLQRAFTRSSASAATFGEKIKGATSGTVVATGAFRGLGQSALIAGGAVGAVSTVFAGLGRSVQIAVSFQRQLSVLQATTGATKEQLQEVSKAAVQLGKDMTLPGVSASDAAQAMTELAKAGLSVEQSIAAARGVLQLATAAQIENTEAVELAASALNAFQLEGDKAVEVADGLANASNAAQGSISDIGLALGQSAAVAHQAGLSFQDTVVFLTELAKAGLRSSDAGTSLKTALIRLIAPTKQVRGELQRLGLSVRDAQGNFRPEFFSDLGAALRGMSKAQQDATLSILGGTDAVRTFAILSRASAGDLAALQAEIAKQGTAAQLAAAQTQGLAGKAESLQNNAETLALSLGNALIPTLSDVFDAANTAIEAFTVLKDKFNDFVDAIPGGSKALELFGRVTRDVAFPILGVKDAVNLAKRGLDLIGGSADNAAEGMRGLAGPVGETEAAFAQLEGPITAAGTALDALQGPVGRAAAAVSALQALLGQVAGFGRKLTAAQITGSVSAQLNALDEIEKRQRRIFALRQRQERAGKIGFGPVDEAQQALLATVQQRRALEAQVAGEKAQAAADAAADAARAKSDRDRRARAAKAAEDARRQAEAETRRRQRQAAERAREIRTQQRNARQFRTLGFTGTGDEVVPGVKALRRVLGNFERSVQGTFLDTKKTRSVVAHIRKVLSGGLGAVGRDVRAKIQQILADLDRQLKDHATRRQLNFRQADTNKILEGLGLTPDQIRRLRGRLSQLGPGGTIPNAGTGAFGVAFNGNSTIVVNHETKLDGRVIEKSTTKHQQTRRDRNPPQRRGRFAGGHI